MSSIRALAASVSSAVVLAFASQAGAAGLITDDIGVVNMRHTFSESLAKATGDETARLRARAFLQELEGTLGSRPEKPQIVDYPDPKKMQVSANMLRATAVVPPQGMEQMDIPVCAEKDSRVLGIWNITAKGAVVPVTNWAGSMVSVGNSAACKDFILAARSDIAAKYAAMQQKQPPSAQTPAPTKSIVVGLNP